MSSFQTKAYFAVYAALDRALEGLKAGPDGEKEFTRYEDMKEEVAKLIKEKHPDVSEYAYDKNP